MCREQEEKINMRDGCPKSSNTLPLQEQSKHPSVLVVLKYLFFFQCDRYVAEVVARIGLYIKLNQVQVKTSAMWFSDCFNLL